MNIVCVQTFPIDYCIDYVHAIASLGRVTLLAGEQSLTGLQDQIDPRIDVVSFSFPRHRSPNNLRLLFQLAHEIRARDPDVVHFLGDSVVWLSLLPRLLGRRPILVTVHDASRHPGDDRGAHVPLGIIDHFRRQATRVIVHGESIRALLAGTGRDPSSIDIVPHVALDRYREVARRNGIKATPVQGRKRLLFFGRIMAYKGLNHLLDATAALRSELPDLELVVAGDGPACEQERDRLAAPRIRMHRGHVEDALVAELFCTSDLVVLPYVEASQSGVLALAAALGRPVLVTDVGELGEIVRATDMGLIVPPADPEALASAIRRFFTEPGLAEALAANSRRAALSGPLSPDHVASRTQAAYQSALDLDRRELGHATAMPGTASRSP